MINDKEILQKAEEFGINPADVEKDYIHGWLLSVLYSRSRLGNRLIFKGGNCLRKAYLPNTRFSKDLDFSVQQRIDSAFLSRELNQICASVEADTGVKFDVQRTRVDPKHLPIPNLDVLESRVYFKGFYAEEKVTLKVQLDITQFDKLYLPVQSCPLIHPYSDSESCRAKIRCQKFEEILASKLNTLLHRRKAVDLFDLLYSVLFCKDYDVNRLEVISTFLRKYIYQSRPDAAKEQLLGIPIEEYRSTWSRIVAPVASLFNFDEVVSNFRGMIEMFFGLIPSSAPAFATAGRGGGRGRFGHLNYFPTGVRSAIINAGQSQTMVELIYDGYRRLVEPYAFEYRIRKRDNQGVEYFWGYDTSGGKSGKQTIKMFICEKIESAKNTSIPFTPQWSIEL